FFTTKPEGVGTGLGLSICYGIAQEHGGRIWVESEAGHGARFVIVLPREPAPDTRPPARPPTAATASTPDAGTAARLSVLIVDDEEALRDALLRFLERRGISGEGAADGTAALRALRERNFDVVISDVRMPGMSGREFLDQLRRDRPGVIPRLVFSTGDTLAPDTAALLRKSGVPTVTKPFDFTQLEGVIRDVAARNAAGRGATSS
ncbi:MAG TPA: response regulator, partial [Gemmatimonadales bacterium]|nr:response regulator [Gemmatimonadales bacterium]